MLCGFRITLILFVLANHTTTLTAATQDLLHEPVEIRDICPESRPAFRVTLVPYELHGRVIGYELIPKAAGVSLLQQHGLIAGDVVIRINGISTTRKQQAIRVLRKLVKASTVELEILRDGVYIPLVITLRP